MKILVLTQWYPPEPWKLFADLAQTLQAQGHEVTVMTGFPNWPSGKVYPGYRLRPWQREVLEGVKVVRVPLVPDHSRSAFRRLFNVSSFALSTACLGVFLTSRPDVVYSIQPPTVAGAAWVLSRMWRVPFTYEVQDMWPESLRAGEMLGNERILGWIGRYCQWIHRKARAIRVISPGFRENLIAKGVEPEKLHVISNWVDTEFYRPVPPDNEMAERLGLSGRFNVMYAGTIGPSQGLDTVLEAALLLQQDIPDAQFVLVGDGLELPRLQEEARKRQIHNIRFLGRHPGSAMPGLYALADALLVYLRDDPLFRITIPHKTFTYMAAGKPVLAAVEGDVATVVGSAGAGVSCESGNPQALAAAVRALYSMSPADRAAMGQRGRDAACNLYSRDHLIGKIGSMLESIVPTKERGARRQWGTPEN